MLNKIILFLAETPAPEIDPDRVRPGLAGLFSFFLLSVSYWSSLTIKFQVLFIGL